MLRYLSDVLVRKHSAIAGTLFAASALGSFWYTLHHGRSAFVDASTLIADARDEQAQKVTYEYTLKFKS